MDLLQDGVIVRSVSGSAAQLNLSNAVPGIHEFSLRARDTAGIMSTSPPARVLVTSAGFQGQSVFFPQFASTNGLIMQNNSTVNFNILHLNQASTGSRGGVWLTTQQNVLSGFVSEFRFRIISKVGGGADGFCFTVAGTAQPNIGTSLGYSGITNSIAVEFDTYQNTSLSDPDDHHIAVHTRGLAANSADESASLGLYTTPADFSDGAVHTAANMKTMTCSCGPSARTFVHPFNSLNLADRMCCRRTSWFQPMQWTMAKSGVWNSLSTATRSAQHKRHLS